MDVPSGTLLQQACALIGCMPEPITREGYVQFLARRVGYSQDVVRREVDRVSATGTAPQWGKDGVLLPSSAASTFRQFSEGNAPSATRLDEKVSIEICDDHAAGWWNRDRGESEDPEPFMYRRYQRLIIIQTLSEWNRLQEWFELTDEMRYRDPECGLFGAEFKAWSKMRNEQCNDAIYREINGAECPDLDEEAEIESELIWGAGGLWDRIVDLGMDWVEEFEERRDEGQTDRVAAESTLRLAEKARRA